MLYAFNCHLAYTPIFNELKARDADGNPYRTVRNMDKVAMAAARPGDHAFRVMPNPPSLRRVRHGSYGIIIMKPAVLALCGRGVP